MSVTYATPSPSSLDTAALARFVRDGYLIVHTSLPPSFHTDICQRAGAILDREGNWGNNVLPRLPELQQVLADPAVHGALSSLLDQPTPCTRITLPSQRTRADRPASAQGHASSPRDRIAPPATALADRLYYPHDDRTHTRPRRARLAVIPEQPDERKCRAAVRPAAGGDRPFRHLAR
jgi:hypothetical protein